MSTDNASFDPFLQSFDMIIPDSPPYNFSISDINDYASYALLISIEYAAQAGACFMLLAVLLLTTRKEKRMTPISFLNLVALLLSAIRNVLQLLYFTGPFYNFYAYISGDYSRVPWSQYSASLAGIAMVLLLLICIEVSLILQVHTVCATMRQSNRVRLTALALAVALVAIGFRFALTVTNARAILAAQSFDNYEWLAAASNYAVAGSICFFSAVFVAKLGAALLARRRLGIIQFGPMQIVFIGGCQTLFIPAIFAILQNLTSVPEFGSFVLTVTSIFMPLSSLWASATLQNRKDAAAGATPPVSEHMRPYNGTTGKQSFGMSSLTSRNNLMTTTTSASDTTSQTGNPFHTPTSTSGSCTLIGSEIGGEDKLDKRSAAHKDIPTAQNKASHVAGTSASAAVAREVRYIDDLLQKIGDV